MKMSFPIVLTLFWKVVFLQGALGHSQGWGLGE